MEDSLAAGGACGGSGKRMRCVGLLRRLRGEPQRERLNNGGAGEQGGTSASVASIAACATSQLRSRARSSLPLSGGPPSFIAAVCEHGSWAGAGGYALAALGSKMSSSSESACADAELSLECDLPGGIMPLGRGWRAEALSSRGERVASASGAARG